MPTRQDSTGRRQTFADIFHNEVTAWLVLAVSLAVTALGWYVAETYVEKRAEERFEFEVVDARDRIVARMQDYEQVLRSGVALFATLGREAQRDEWRTFVEGLQIERNFPGIQGMGYAVMLTPDRLDAHVAAVRAEGFPAYTVKPDGPRDAYSAIVYLEPFDWRNQRAFGFDMYSNAMRRRAMDHARDTGEAAVSGRVTLVQETREDVQAGFLVYLPVYRGGYRPADIEQRRQTLRGFVYSPFRMADLMAGILGSEAPEVDFALFDGTAAPSDDNLLYDSAPTASRGLAERTMRVSIPFPGRSWQAVFTSTARFEAGVASRQPELIAIGGLVVDLLLFAIIRSLGTERCRVAAKAHAITAELRQANERLDLAHQAADIGTWELEVDSGRLYWDERMRELYGGNAGEIGDTLRDWQRHVHADDRDAFEKALSRAIADGTRVNETFRIIGGDGVLRATELHAKLHRDTEGRPQRLVGINLDVSARMEAEARLLQAASVFDHAHEGILITDTARRIIDVNPAFEQLTGYSREEVVGLSPAVMRSGMHDDTFYRGIWDEIDRNGFWRGEIWNRRKSGELAAQLETISVVRDVRGEIKHYIGIFSDITKMVEQQNEMQHLAHHDALTGLPNRVLLSDRLQRAMGLARRHENLLAVCYLDLDGFKPINDRYGHAAGDMLLVAVAARLTALLRESDSVARLGGDEFVLLLGDIADRADCVRVLDRLVAGLGEAYLIDEQHSVQIAASVGVALFPSDDVDADTLLRHADQAMYVAKEAGRGRYSIFDAEQGRRTRDRKNRLSRIEAGLQGNEFVLYFQPKVNMRLGTVVGAEALIRWQDPERGILPPSDFLPLVERHELAIALDDWVIGEAVRLQAGWLAQGVRLPVGVNVSGRYLLKGGLAESVRRALSAHPSVDAAMLELEVLESSALDDLAAVARSIEQCRRIGLSVALDDFGTGYSSLSHLRRLPADILKIDRSFVGEMLTDSGGHAIVEGVIGLSRAFHRQVIAEGVESDAHVARLLELGCELGQGYGIARPMPADAVPGWVRHGARYGSTAILH
ncbi:MAG: EAL domain-containing protein [Rhodocyclaceae bacterium]|nr:EAL domain-containing protein [Rhodocyclaceae bacterium]